MLVYLPYYDRGFKVLCVDASKAKYHHTPGYSAVIAYQRVWYNADNIFKTYDAAVAWIQRDYKAYMPFMLSWEVLP